MENKFCPLLSLGQSVKVPCDSNCAFSYATDDVQGCAFYMIAKYSKELSEKLDK